MAASRPAAAGASPAPPVSERSARVSDARGVAGTDLRERQILASAESISHPTPAPGLPARVSDARDPAGAIWRDGTFRRDGWVHAAEGEPLPEAPAILSRERWLAERDTLAGRNAPLGLRLDAGERIDDIAADLAHFALIALSFPKFTDGRAFSTARLLREKHGYMGELRAVGNVLSDQIPLMRRVGFDAFEVSHAPTRRALEEGRIPEVTLHYQPAGTRPWLRRCGG